MALKPSTIGLLLTALILGGVVYLTQSQETSSSNPSDPSAETEQANNSNTDSSSQALFSFEEKQVQSLTLKTQLRSLSFQRDDKGIWQMTEPASTPANDATVAYLLNLLATGQSSRTFDAPATQQEEFGFHQPMADIELKLDNQETHRFIVGGYDFNRSLLYAQADPAPDAADTLKVLLVSPDFDNAVNRPLSDWKAQPPKASPSSSSSPSP